VRSSALSFDRFANDYAVSKQFAPGPVKGSTTMERRAASAGAFEATAAGRFALTNQNPAPPIRTSNAAIPMVTGRSAERFFGAANCAPSTPTASAANAAWCPSAPPAAASTGRIGLDLFPESPHEHVGAAVEWLAGTVTIRRGCLGASKAFALVDLAPSQVVSQ
jgi:hypothetical protein